ncbi:MAG TPA: hypothetical protein PLX49_04345 [Prolixibacteraceae bacterium]|jgi:hypothetical protein|nr:hypothetical protein [Bacteroidales bacterium]HNQ38187.1 hypothetical protein [Prolixibacteraceae bacterium]HOY50971.1 hypothetical protein [Prolixibacteraceae bacterium]
MGEARRKKQNTLGMGLATGIILPLAIFVIFYLSRYSRIPFFSFVSQLAEMNMLVKLFSLCGFANLLAFFFFYRRQMDQAAKGVVAATFLYAFAVLLSRIIEF